MKLGKAGLLPHPFPSVGPFTIGGTVVREPQGYWECHLVNKASTTMKTGRVGPKYTQILLVN